MTVDISREAVKRIADQHSAVLNDETVRLLNALRDALDRAEAVLAAAGGAA